MAHDRRNAVMARWHDRRMPQRVTVVGAGVIGLTCAVRLAETGLDVDVLARDLPLETASAVGGGLWLPATSDERELAWARTGLDELRAVEGAASGVRFTTGHLLGGTAGAAPSWAERFGDVVRLEQESAPAIGHAVGWRAELPLADPRRYLRWLRDRLIAAGGTLTRLALPALPGRGIVVDAAGVAARALAADPRVRPVRIQVALVENPGLDVWWVDLAGDLSVLPFADVAAVEAGGDDGDWNTAPDEAAAQRLVERAGEIVPRLRGAALVGVRVGLRPARPGVRLEAQRRPTDEDADQVIVHCYGHGSRGFTLSWGCADEVSRLVTGALEGRAASRAG
jgi:D-amino-acid oxidase